MASTSRRRLALFAVQTLIFNCISRTQARQQRKHRKVALHSWKLCDNSVKRVVGRDACQHCDRKPDDAVVGVACVLCFGLATLFIFYRLESRVGYGIQIGERCSITYLLRLFVAADLTQISTGQSRFVVGQRGADVKAAGRIP